jgi:hypothetical protein
MIRRNFTFNSLNSIPLAALCFAAFGAPFAALGATQVATKIGVTFTSFQSQWVSTQAYTAGMVVTYPGTAGASYICLVANTGVAPNTNTADWAIMDPPGATGPAGPQGLTGPAGPLGPTGAAGAQGPTGPQGLIGPIGQVGATGANGLQGVQGTQGPIGATGPVGPQGPTGPQGPSGVLSDSHQDTSAGINALPNNTGSGNTAYGYNAIAGSNSGVVNTGLGFNALRQNTSGSAIDPACL